MADEIKRNDPAKTEVEKAKDDANRDPLSGRAGAHPVGTGVGAAAGAAAGGLAGVGAAAATGAGVGTVMGGPVGTAVGAAVGVAGAVIGGLIGKGVAESINPTEEHGYWRQNYTTRPYADKTAAYETYAPAYQYGWESQSKYSGKSFDESESTLRRDWDKAKGKSELEWDRAKEAVRDSWNRVSNRSASSRGTSDTSSMR